MTETVVEHPDFTEIWHCEQPETYRVLREQWRPDAAPKPIREVYEVEALS